jgi:CRP/FNR family transcriptional regulator, cyclic AMP receptor protein
MTIVDVIQSSHVFKRLSRGKLDKLANIAHEETYEPGQYIFKEGDQARNFYIIEEGKVELQVEIAIATSPRKRPRGTIDIITQGTSLGWATLVGRDVFSGSAKAIDKCKLIALDGAQLRELMDSDITLGYEVMKRFSQEITHTIDAMGQMLVSERGLALLSEEHSY